MCSCGTSKFALMDLGDPPSPPKASKKKHNKNPYAAYGLDKFSKVLAELESRREKIMSITGPQALIRFVYDNTHDWVPIIVRPKPEKKKLKATARIEIKETSEKGAVVKKRRMKGSEKRLPWLGLRGSSCYNYDFLLVMVVVLGCVVISGTVFAICCTCVWWYMMPVVIMKEKAVNNKRKDYGRRLRDRRLINKRVVIL